MALPRPQKFPHYVFICTVVQQGTCANNLGVENFRLSLFFKLQLLSICSQRETLGEPMLDTDIAISREPLPNL